MDIQTYIKQSRGHHAKALAQMAGTSVGYLRLLSYGLRRPSADMALKLEHASGGLITARELRPDLGRHPGLSPTRTPPPTEPSSRP